MHSFIGSSGVAHFLLILHHLFTRRQLNLGEEICMWAGTRLIKLLFNFAVNNRRICKNAPISIGAFDRLLKYRVYSLVALFDLNFSVGLLALCMLQRLWSHAWIAVQHSLGTKWVLFHPLSIRLNLFDWRQSVARLLLDFILRGQFILGNDLVD